MRWKCVLACVGAAPLLLAAAQPVRLQPSSPWDVDYAENSCRLIRVFGTGKDTTKLAFESAAPGELDMLVVGKPLRTYDERVPARFLPVGGETFDGMVAQTVGNGDPAILWSHPRLLPDAVVDKLDKEGDERGKNPAVRRPAESLAKRDEYKKLAQDFAAGVTQLEIQTRHNRPVILETGSLRAAMAAFEQCTRDSLRDWGVDPDLEDRIVRPVWAINPSGWLFASDYPADLLTLSKESEVAVRLLVDAAGNVTKCTSLSHFSDEEFNRISCDRITARARFEPAELGDGTKVPSYYTRRVKFRIAR